VRRALALLLLTGSVVLPVLQGIGATPAAQRLSPFGHADPVRPVSQAVAPLPADAPHTCPLCEGTPSVPIVHLTQAMADSVGRVYSGFNQALFAHLDSLYRSGEFGDPGARESRRRVHVLSRLLALNSLHYMVSFATDPDHIWEADEKTLQEAFKRYSDPGIYPIVRLERARMGQGYMCVHYDVSTDMESTMTLGNLQVGVRIHETEFEGETKRMLMMDLPTIMFSTIEVVLDEHFSCKAELFHSSGPPAPHDVYLLYDIQGLAVRKWGVHKPGAMIFWSTPRDLQRTRLPALPLVGSAVYVPGVRLELPSILPDMKFKDLRLVDLPQPILEQRYVRSHGYPDWLEHNIPRGFKNWESYGPIPPDLQRRFPDL